MALVELRIADLAVLRSVSLVPGEGLTALTGETGSGKSLCVTGLRLALGGRVDGEVVARGRDRASVAAVFDAVPAGVRELCSAQGIAVEELLTLSREIPASGRGSCRVNGSLVSIATLREIGEQLVEITAQGESHRLLRAAWQRRLLDAMGGETVAAARRTTAAAVVEWRAAEEAERLAGALAAREHQQLERARELVDDLGPLHLAPGEDAALAAECARLRGAARLRAAADALGAACSGGEEGSAADLVAAAVATGRPVAATTGDGELTALVDDGGELVSHLTELGRRARRLAAQCEVDDRRLAVVEERLDVLDRVRRRHGGSLETALSRLEEAAALVEAAGGDSTPERLAAAAQASRSRAAEAAAALSRGRRTAAAALERAVTAELRRLRLPHARFRVGLHRTPDEAGVELDGVRVTCGAEGVDGVEFRLGANRDEVPLPLDEGVSGGELSRLGLALRAVVADADDCPTLVLDEVDTGLGGETAARVGEVLAAVARRRQVLVITHRPEIAAPAARHLVVAKRDRGGRVEAAVDAVEGEERAGEVARLMSGTPTEAALARARELLAYGDGGAAMPALRPARTIGRDE
jgi:DNA repair protein RecN (Recombination protein N)